MRTDSRTKRTPAPPLMACGHDTALVQDVRSARFAGIGVIECIERQQHVGVVALNNPAGRGPNAGTVVEWTRHPC